VFIDDAAPNAPLVSSAALAEIVMVRLDLV
jgi:hypothetical protein